MIPRKEAPAVLADKGEVVIKAAGGSMRPLMDTGDSLFLKKVDPLKLRKGDAVFCKCGGSVFVHLIEAIENKGERFKIGNNFGHTNGWTSARNIYGLCVRVNDRILVSEDELAKR